jgi:uncharacterized lipoprotein YehR (DUF1307 family)
MLTYKEAHTLFIYQNGKIYNRLTRNSMSLINEEVGTKNEEEAAKDRKELEKKFLDFTGHL